MLYVYIYCLTLLVFLYVLSNIACDMSIYTVEHCLFVYMYYLKLLVCPYILSKIACFSICNVYHCFFVYMYCLTLLLCTVYYFFKLFMYCMHKLYESQELCRSWVVNQSMFCWFIVGFGSGRIGEGWERSILTCNHTINP